MVLVEGAAQKASPYKFTGKGLATDGANKTLDMYFPESPSIYPHIVDVMIAFMFWYPNLVCLGGTSSRCLG